MSASTNQIELKDWKRFISALCLAEKAAADQCLYLAQELRALGQNSFADTYLAFAQEEEAHYEIMLELVDGPLEITEKAQAVYSGSLLSKNPTLVERMAVVHLAFEPSALAFLGHIFLNVHKYFNDPKMAEKIQVTFEQILRDEAGHIIQGKHMVKEMIAKEPPQVAAEIQKSLRRHQAFLKLGLISFFGRARSLTEESFVQTTLDNYGLRTKNLFAEIHRGDLEPSLA